MSPVRISTLSFGVGLRVCSQFPPFLRLSSNIEHFKQTSDRQTFLCLLAQTSNLAAGAGWHCFLTAAYLYLAPNLTLHSILSTNRALRFGLRMSSVEEAANELRERWNEFIVAIKDIEHDFNQFYWIHVLSLSAIKYIFHLSRIIHVIRFVKMHRGQFVQLIPGFAIGLVFIVISSYVTVFHHEIIVPRWCSCDEGYISCKADGFVGNSDCRSSIVIKLVSLYLTSMIMFNYLQTTLRSPGVMPSLERNNSLGAGRTPSDERGGCCFFIKPKFNQLRENEIVALNGKIVTEEHYPGDDKKVFLPSPNSSYCEKCKIHRPPRCHHCSRCNRCVLQVCFM